MTAMSPLDESYLPSYSIHLTDLGSRAFQGASPFTRLGSSGKQGIALCCLDLVKLA